MCKKKNSQQTRNHRLTLFHYIQESSPASFATAPTFFLFTGSTLPLSQASCGIAHPLAFLHLSSHRRSESARLRSDRGIGDLGFRGNARVVARSDRNEASLFDPIIYCLRKFLVAPRGADARRIGVPRSAIAPPLQRSALPAAACFAFP